MMPMPTGGTPRMPMPERDAASESDPARNREATLVDIKRDIETLFRDDPRVARVEAMLDMMARPAGDASSTPPREHAGPREGSWAMQPGYPPVAR